MLNLNYSKYDVFVMWLKGGGAPKPSADQLAQFDQDLFDANEAALLEIMNQQEIEIRKDTKSTVLLYSRFTGGTADQKIRAACKFFKHVQQL